MEARLVAITWKELAKSGWLRFAGVRGAKPEHLLWGLLFMKTYAVEELHASMVGACETTFRKWAWFYAEGVANLDRKFVRIVSLVPLFRVSLLCCCLACSLLVCFFHI